MVFSESKPNERMAPTKSKLRRISLLLVFMVLACVAAGFGAVNHGFVSSAGTLIVFVPARNGLVVGADSRSTINLGGQPALHCDTTVKIRPLEHQPRSVVAVSGTDKSYGENVQISGNACEFLRQAAPLVDATQLAVSYLDTNQSPVISRVVFKSLEDFFLTTIRSVQSEHPNLLHNSNGSFFTVALGQYLPETHTSLIAFFKLCIPNNQPVEVCKDDWHAYGPGEPRKLQSVGDSDFLTAKVFSETGAKIVGGHYLEKYNEYLVGRPAIPGAQVKPLRTASITDAKGAALDLLKTTELVSKRFTQTIGGPIHLVLLSSMENPQIIQ